MAGQVNIGGAFVSLRAKTADFIQGTRRSADALRRQERTLRSLRGTVRRTSASFRAFRSQVFSIRGAVGLLAGSGGLGLLIKRQADFGATLVETSRQVGFSVERLQLLGRAFQGEGGNIETLNKGLLAFSRSIAEADRGVSTYKAQFEALGVTLREEGGALRDSEDILLDMADGLRALEDPARRANAVMTLFGARNAAFLNILQNGSRALREQENAFRRLGVVRHEEAVALKALAQSFTDVGNAAQVAAARGVAQAAGALQRLNQQLIEQGPKAIAAMVGSIAHLADNLNALRDTALLFAGGLVVKWAAGIGRMALALRGLGAAAIAARLGLATLAGPAGWLATAAGALLFYRTRTREAVIQTRALREEVLRLAEAGQFQAVQQRIVTVVDTLATIHERIVDLNRRIEASTNRIHQTNLKGRLAALQRQDDVGQDLLAGLRRLEQIALERAEQLKPPGAGGGLDTEPGLPPPVASTPADFAADIGTEIERRNRAAQQGIELIGREGTALAALQARHVIGNRLADERLQLHAQLARAQAALAAAEEAGNETATQAAQQEVASVRASLGALDQAFQVKDRLIQQTQAAIQLEQRLAAATADRLKLAEREAAAAAGRRQHRQFLGQAQGDLDVRAARAIGAIARTQADNARRSASQQLLAPPSEADSQARKLLEERFARLYRDHRGAVLEQDWAKAESLAEQLSLLPRQMEEYATRLQAVLDLEKQREQLAENSLANAQAALAARTAALRAKNVESESERVRRGASAEEIEQRREKLLARRGPLYRRFHERAVRNLRAELFQRQRNLELLREELRRRAKLQLLEGDKAAAKRLRDQAKGLGEQAGELGALAGDSELVRQQFKERLKQEASEQVVARLYARRVRQAEALRELGKDTATILTSGLAKAVEQGGKLKDIFKQIGIQLAMLALQKLVIDRAAGLLTSFLGPRLQLGGAPATPATPAPSAPAGPVRFAAGGGPVAPGQLYRVGESGEEWFRPNMAGTIIPNHRLRSMGGAGGGNVFHFHFNIESTDGPGVEAAIERVRPALLNDAVEASRNVIGRDLGRNSKLRGLARG